MTDNMPETIWASIISFDIQLVNPEYERAVEYTRTADFERILSNHDQAHAAECAGLRGRITELEKALKDVMDNYVVVVNNCTDIDAKDCDVYRSWNKILLDT